MCLGVKRRLRIKFLYLDGMGGGLGESFDIVPCHPVNIHFL